MATGENSKYYRNQVSIAETHGIHVSTISQILRQAGVRGTNQGYSKLLADKAVRDYKASDVKFDGSLKDEKLKREIKLLDIEIDRELKKLISIEDHVADIRTIASEVKAGLEQWLQWVAAEIKDAKVYERAMTLNDRLLLSLAEKTDEPLTDTPRVATGDPAKHAA